MNYETCSVFDKSVIRDRKFDLCIHSVKSDWLIKAIIGKDLASKSRGFIEDMHNWLIMQHHLWGMFILMTHPRCINDDLISLRDRGIRQ